MFEESVVTSEDGTRLRVRTAGAGRAVLMLHGFLANAESNYIQPGVAQALLDEDRFLILPDLRGHGGSDKPEDLRFWPGDVLASDAEAVLKAFDVVDYDLVGYSLGARTAVRLMARGARPRRAVLGGMGAAGVLEAGARARFFEDCILHGDAAQNPQAGRRVRRMISEGKLEPAALLGVLASFVPTDRETLAALTVPTLVLCGAVDEDNGSAEALAALLPQARARRTPGDHLSAISAPEFPQAILEFLKEGPAPGPRA